MKFHKKRKIKLVPLSYSCCIFKKVEKKSKFQTYDVIYYHSKNLHLYRDFIPINSRKITSYKYFKLLNSTAVKIRRRLAFFITFKQFLANIKVLCVNMAKLLYNFRPFPHNCMHRSDFCINESLELHSKNGDVQ